MTVIQSLLNTRIPGACVDYDTSADATNPYHYKLTVYDRIITLSGVRST